MDTVDEIKKEIELSKVPYIQSQKRRIYLSIEYAKKYGMMNSMMKYYILKNGLIQ